VKRNVGWGVLFGFCLAIAVPAAGGEPDSVEQPDRWHVGPSILSPGSGGSFDEMAVKDPSVVFFGGQWHLFYTARGGGQYVTGYVAGGRLEDLGRARRHELRSVRGKASRYGCAPQVFYFAPQKKWYLIFQTRDANYQPAYSTTSAIDEPESWSEPRPLVTKDEPAKWIDFWVICDSTMAYLFFTRGHRDVCVKTTDIARFPQGFTSARRVFGPVHEAVHVYKVEGRERYHMFYETLLPGSERFRRYGLATAEHLLGPWERISDDFARGDQLAYALATDKWTEEVSHGELIRAGYDQRLEYDPERTTLLIQGLLAVEHEGPYPELPWRVGLIRKEARGGVRESR